jgi:hypothetical protein
MKSLDEYINNISSEENLKEYLNYQDYLKRYYEYKESIIEQLAKYEEAKDKNQKKMVIKSFYKEEKEFLEIYLDKKIHLKIHKPIYQNIFKKIENLKDESEILEIDHNILNKSRLFEQDTKDYEKNLNKILDIDTQIKILYEYFILINNLEDKLSILLENMHNIYETKNKLYDQILKENDLTNRKDLINNYIKFNNDLKVKKLNNNLLTYGKKGTYIDFVIEKLPRIELIPQTKQSELKIKKEKVEKEVAEMEQKIEAVLIDQFKFKTALECKSKTRSALFYMTKNDILNIINNNEKLKEKMPPNYKSLKKEAICDILAKNKYITKN